MIASVILSNGLFVFFMFLAFFSGCLLIGFVAVSAMNTNHREFLKDHEQHTDQDQEKSVVRMFFK